MNDYSDDDYDDITAESHHNNNNNNEQQRQLLEQSTTNRLSLPDHSHNGHHRPAAAVTTPLVDTLSNRLFGDDLMVTSADASLSRYQCLLNNLEQCTMLANRMKSLLGPRSRDKLLIDEDGEISVTNDGATALLFVNDHLRLASSSTAAAAATKILTQLSVSMDDESGDGTTSVVILAGALLNQASFLIKNYAVHPRWVIRGYTLALKLALDFLSRNAYDDDNGDRSGGSKDVGVKRLSQRIDPFHASSRTILLQVAKTCLNSKIASYAAPRLADIAVSAILNSGGSEKRVHVIRGGVSQDNPMVSGFRGGTSMNESVLVPGNNVVLLTQSMFSAIVDMKRAKVAVLVFELDIGRGISSHQYRVDVPSLSQLDRLIKEEETYYKKLAVYLKKLGVQVLCVQESISGSSSTLADSAINWIKRSGVQLLKPLKVREVEHLCQVFQIAPIVSYEQLQSLATESSKTMAVPYVKQIDLVKSHTIGEQQYMVFYSESDPENRGERHSTVILRAPSQVAIDELERALHDTLRVLSTLIAQPVLLPGGGTCEIAASVYLQLLLDGEIDDGDDGGSRRYLQQISSSVERMAIQSFCKAMEEIPLTLCHNAGANPVSTLNQLKRIHKKALLLTSESAKLNNDANQSQPSLRHGLFIPQSDSGPVVQISDMFTNGVIEPFASKYAQWQMATNAALQILKIDGMFERRNQ